MGAKPFYCDIDGQRVGILKDWRQNPLTTALRTTLGLSLTTEHTGLTVFDTDLNSLFTWTGATWATSGGVVPPASEVVAGILEIATQIETNGGLDDVRAVTPLKLATYIASLPSGGQTENFSWKFSGDSAATDPTNGKFKFNNAPALATQLYVNDLCDLTGLDVSTLFNSLSGNFYIYIQQSDDATKFIQLATVAPWTDNGGWFTIPVSVIQVGSGGIFTIDAKCTWYIINKNTGGGGSGSSVQGNLFAGGGISTPSTLGLALDSSGLYYLLPAGAPDNVYTFSDGLQLWGMVNQKGPYIASFGGILPGVDRTAQLNTIFADSRVSEVVLDEGDITIDGTLNCQGKFLTVRGNGRIVGVGTVDSAIINAGSRQVIFALTVNITNSQANGEYFHAKWYGTVGTGAVNDQPPLQKSSDTVIANIKMPRTVQVVGGETYRLDSPWIMYKWTGTDYTFFTCNIHGTQSAFFANGAATGHAVFNANTTQTFGIGYQVARSSTISGIIVRGPFSPTFNPFNRLDYLRPYATWASDYGMRDTFHSPLSGIVLDPFRNTPALPPDGGYPGLSAWYRGTNIGSGSSAIRIKDCEVSGFTVDIMCSPNGVTQNCEDIHIEDCRLEVAKVAYASGQDQIKNNTIVRAVTWDRVHTLMDTRSYGFGTGLLPNVDGWNVASGTIMRLWNVDGLRFPASIKNIFSELLYSLGDGDGGAGQTVSDCEFGFNTFGPYYIPQSHATGGSFKFTNCRFQYYDLLFNVPIVFYGPNWQFDDCLINQAPVLNNPYQNTTVNCGSFQNCRTGHGLLGYKTIDSSDTAGNNYVAYGNVNFRRNTYNTPGGATVAGGVGNVNYDFDCGSYIGYTLLGCCFDYTVDDATRKMTVNNMTGLAGSRVTVGDWIIDEDTNQYYGVVESIDRTTGIMIVRNVPTDIVGSNLAWTFGVMYVRRIAGHFIGDVTSGSNIITNCEFDPAFPAPVAGTRLHLGLSNGRELVIDYVSGNTVVLSGNVDFTATGLYFPPVSLRNCRMESYISMYFDPKVYTDLLAVTSFPMMFPLGAKITSEVTGSPQDYYSFASEYVVAKPGFLQPSSIGRANQAIFNPVQRIIETGVPDTIDYLTFTKYGTGQLQYISIADFLAILPPVPTPVLTATPISATRIDLTWVDVTGEASYLLQVSLNNISWTTIGGVIPAGTTSYSHTGLTAVTHYYYRLRAIGDGVTNSSSGFSFDDTTTLDGSFPHLSTFTDVDGTLLDTYVPEAGSQWSMAAGQWEIISNKAVPKLPFPGGDATTMLTNCGSTQDYTLTINCTVGSATPYLPVYFRQGPGVGLLFLVLHASIYMIDNAAGGANIGVLGLASDFTEREIKFVVSGNTVTTYVNSVLIDSARVFNAGNNGTNCGFGQLNSAIVETSVSKFEVN